MKRLILMRHAKSSWDHPTLRDHERPLNTRGKRDAPRIGQVLEEIGWHPQVVLSSDAQRTKETWELLAPKLSISPLVSFLPSLYHAGLGRIQASIEFIHPQTSTIMIIGHNPGWSEAQSWLSGEYIDFKTASTALLSSPKESWSEAIQTPKSWKLEHMLHPRDLA